MESTEFLEHGQSLLSLTSSLYPSHTWNTCLSLKLYRSPLVWAPPSTSNDFQPVFLLSNLIHSVALSSKPFQIFKDLFFPSSGFSKYFARVPYCAYLYLRACLSPLLAGDP